MEKNRSDISPVYYNVPQLKEVYTSPVLAVGIVEAKGEQGARSIRIVIRRDLSVKLSDFALKYRFADSGEENGEKKFYGVVYDKEDLNTRQYLYIVLNVPAGRFQGACTALVSSVTFENGRTVTYRISDYEVTEDAPLGGDFRNPNLNDASPLLREYIAYLSAKGKVRGENGAKTETPQKQNEAPSVSASSRGTADAATTKNPPSVPAKKRIRKSRRNIFATPGGIFVAVVVGAAVLALAGTAISSNSSSAGEYSSVENGLSDKEMAGLLASKNFSKAYQLAKTYGDVVDLQNVCEQAAKHYESVRNFDKAYLYAGAAPEPFQNRVMDSFVEYAVSEDKFPEAYDFLSTLDRSTDALQTLCGEAVEKYLAAEDFLTAFSYAEKAPASLTDTVFRAAEGQLLNDGKVNAGALAVLQKNDNEGELDQLISENAGTVADFEVAYSMAVSIKDETLRANTVFDVALSRMKVLVDENNLSDAHALFNDASLYITDVQKDDCLSRMLSYASMRKNTAGEILFKNLCGQDTSDIRIEAEDLSVRANVSEVYFLLTEKQKRDYHAVCFDLYKEAYYIQSGTLSGTDITDAVSVSTFEYQTIILHENGTVSAIDDGHSLVLTMPADNDIVQIAAGLNHAVFLHGNGTVSGSGSGKWGQLNVSGWSNVVKVVSGSDFTVGLLADGTLVACGSNLSGQCEVGAYEKVLDIAACDQSLVILFRDGSVKVVGDVSLGLRRADNFNNIKRIRAAAFCIIAETENGTFVMAHEGTGDVGSVLRWSNNVRWFAAGALCVGNVDAYGRINIEGDGAPVRELDS